MVTNSFIFYLCFDKERYLHKKTYKFAKAYQNQFSQIFWQARAEQLTKRVAKIQAHIQRFLSHTVFLNYTIFGLMF